MRSDFSTEFALHLPGPLEVPFVQFRETLRFRSVRMLFLDHRPELKINYLYIDS